ncbi:hypothetical protein IKS_05370 [Bacillus cereus VDM062]|nr:hypothetical protein IKS_05370 [Bacillus cereus VDM062]
MKISNKKIEELKKAGWYEGRKIDISENVKFLEERGFEVFESAKKFIILAKKTPSSRNAK